MYNLPLWSKLFDWIVFEFYKGNILPGLIGGMISCNLEAIIHELGHALIARFLGWKISQICIGGRSDSTPKWTIKWRVFRIRFPTIGGEVVEHIPSYPGAFNYRIYASGGVFLNLLAVVLCATTAFYGLQASFMIGFGVVQALSILNFIPVKTAKSVSDGYALFWPQKTFDLKMSMRGRIITSG